MGGLEMESSCDSTSDDESLIWTRVEVKAMGPLFAFIVFHGHGELPKVRTDSYPDFVELGFADVDLLRLAEAFAEGFGW